MSNKLAPCDHDECSLLRCDKPGAVLHGDEVREALSAITAPHYCEAHGGPECSICRAADFIEQQVRRLQSELDRLRGCERVPDGWRLVPVEPTPEMIFAGRVLVSAYPEGRGTWLEKESAVDCYRAMLAAAPDAAISGAAKDDKTFRGENESGSGIGDSHRRNGGEA